MADGSVTISITGDVGDVEKKLQEVNDKLNAVGSEGSKTAQSGFEGASSSASNLADKGLKAIATAAAAAGTALVAGATAAATAGMQYESAFAQVATIMDTTQVSTEEMSTAIMDLSNSTGIAAADLSDSVYNAISATGDTAGAVSLAADASKLATAGFAETGDALSVLTTITNAYGMSTDEASAISDSLIETQNLGVTTVAQLASSMGKAIATASAYSIDLNNLEASYVSLTKAGISTEESTTYLSSMFNELGDSGSDVAGILQDETGMSFGQLMDAGYSLGDVLGILVDSVNGDSEALMNLWGSAEAGKAASAIAGQGIETFNENLNTLANSAGTTESAYETMTGTMDYQLNLLKTRVTNFGTTVYEKFSGPATEAVGTLAEAFGDLIESVQEGELSDEMDNIASAISDLVSTAAGLVSDVLPGIISGFSWMLDNLDTIATLLVGGVAAFGAYKAVVALTTAEEIAATIATEGLTAALSLNPVGLAVAGIVAGAAAMSVFVDWLSEAASNSDSVASQCEAISSEMEDMANSVEDTVSAYQSLKAETDSNAASASELISQLDGMVSAYDGSASSASDIQDVVEQLNSLIPDLNLSFDEESGALSETAEKMQLLNEQYAAQAEYDASKDAEDQLRQDRITAIEAQQDALEKLTTAQETYDAEVAAGNDAMILQGYQDDIDAAQKAYDDATAVAQQATNAFNEQQMATNEAANALDDAAEAVENYGSEEETTTDNTKRLSDEQKALIGSLQDIRDGCTNATGTASELREQYDELKKTYDDLETEGQDYRRELTEQALQQLNMRATTAEVAEGLGYLASTAQLDYSTISAQLIATGEDAETFASTVTSALDNVVNGYEKYDDSAWTSLSDAQAALESNTAAQQNWVGNLETLWNYAVSTGDAGQMAYVQSLYNMGIESSSMVASMVDSNGNVIASSLTSMSESYAESTAAAGEQAALGLAMSAGEVYEAGQAVAEQGAQGIADASTSENSEAGTQAATDFASGMEAGTGTVTAAASAIVSSTSSVFSGYSWSSIGHNISAGVAAGVRSGSGLITSAARSAALAAYNSAKSTLQINSPSHLFRDKIGASVPEGMAVGIMKNTHIATDAVKQSASEIYKSARLATTPIVQTVSNMTTNNSSNILKSSQNGNQTVTITVPLSIDSREVARATTSQIVNQYDFMYS